MKANDFSKLTDEALVEIYEEAARAHGDAIDRGDSRSANKAHGRLAAAYRTLRSRGDGSRGKLLQFLGSDNLHLRGWAAAHALEFSPAEGEPVLRELASAPTGLPSLNAEMVLSVWEEGDLEFP